MNDLNRLHYTIFADAANAAAAATALGLGTADSPTHVAITLTNGQVVFPATQVASAGANTLDDYEEGTFTPGVSFGGGTTGITYVTQVGEYTKIGNRVFFNLRVGLTAKGSSTGTALVTGLPFTSANTATGQASCAVGSVTNLSAGTTTQVTAFVTVNATTIDLQSYAAGTATALADTNFSATSVLLISGHYRV